MSGSASLGLEQAVLGHTLGYAAMPFPGQVWVALCAMAPAPSENTGGAEVSGGGYVRAAATFALADPPANIAANTTSVEFPTATAAWGTVGYFELWDAPTGGHRLYWGTLLDPADNSTPTTITINAGDITRFSPGALAVMAATSVGSTITIGGYLPLTGGVLTGALTLAADPTAPLAAATKGYVDANRGSALGPVIATGSTTPRLPQDRFAATYDLRDFGAKCDGIVDDTAAFNAAIAKLITFLPGGKLILGAGRTLLASAITATIPVGCTLTIEGLGAAASELYFSTASDGLSFTLANSGPTCGGVHLRSFSITRGPTSPAIANTGLSISVAHGAMYTGTSSLRDLIVGGSVRYTNQWRTSVILAGVSATTVDNVTINGNNATATDTGDILLSILGGPANSQYGVSYNIINCVLVGGSCGVQVSQWVQGVFINNSTVIGQYDSIRWTLGGTYAAEELAVTNCTLNGGHRGLYVSQVNQCSISNTTILRFNGNATANFAGVELNQSGFNNVTGNNIIGALAGTETGILLSACSTGPNTVVGNLTGNLNGAGVWCQGNSNFNTVVGNNLTGGTGIIQDTAGNIIVANQWNGNPVGFSPTTINGDLALKGASGAAHVIYENTAAAGRWYVGDDGATESGSDSGSNFEIVAVRDNGTLLGPMLRITRTGAVLLFNAPQFINLPSNAANDAAAQTAGVPIGGVYRNGSVVMVRIS